MQQKLAFFKKYISQHYQKQILKKPSEKLLDYFSDINYPPSTSWLETASFHLPTLSPCSFILNWRTLPVSKRNEKLNTTLCEKRNNQMSPFSENILWNECTFHFWREQVWAFIFVHQMTVRIENIYIYLYIYIKYITYM